MTESVRLSDASKAVVEALSCFNHAALEELANWLQAAIDGRVKLEREPLETIENNQKVLAGVLMATEQNLAILRRLKEREAGDLWAR